MYFPEIRCYRCNCVIPDNDITRFVRGNQRKIAVTHHGDNTETDFVANPNTVVMLFQPSGATTPPTPPPGPTAFSVINATVAVGGSAYVVGDMITLTGGTANPPATGVTPLQNAVLQVTAINAGAVTGVNVIGPGSYSVKPANPVAQGSTTHSDGSAGGGSAATFVLNWNA
jgi:hypothetical protein